MRMVAADDGDGSGGQRQERWRLTMEDDLI